VCCAPCLTLLLLLLLLLLLPPPPLPQSLALQLH
jgi:hypothetical protein